DPADDPVPEGLEKDAGIREREVEIARAIEPRDGGADALADLRDAMAGRQPFVTGPSALRDRPGHPLRETVQQRAVVEPHLAPEQIEPLDAVRALVDRVQPVVAIMLLDRVVARVSVAAVHLDGQTVGLQAPLRRPALADRREQLEQRVRPTTFG